MKNILSFTKVLVLGSLIVLNGCGGGGSSDVNSTDSTQVGGNINNTTISTTETGRVTIYPKNRSATSILAEARVEDKTGIENITLYCIDAYKYYKKNRLVIVAKSSKDYNSAKTKIEFYQHKFTNLSPSKSYILKVVAKTEAGELAQQTTTATLPLPYPGIDVNVGNYNIYHHTLPLYTFDFSPIYVKNIKISEFDGDGGKFNVYLVDESNNQITVATNIVSSGDGVSKVHTLTNPNPNVKVKQIKIKTQSSLGGLWQIDYIKLNP